MRPITMLTLFSFVMGGTALADDKPTIVSVITPENWTHQHLSNGFDQYLPLEIAKQGRPGAVNCNVIAESDEESRLWSQETIDNSLARIAPRFMQGSLGAQGGGMSATMTPISQGPIEVSGHNAFLVLSKGHFSQGTVSANGRLATMFFAVPGWEYIATCTAAGPTENDAETAWNAWEPTLLAIIESLHVQY